MTADDASQEPDDSGNEGTQGEATPETDQKLVPARHLTDPDPHYFARTISGIAEAYPRRMGGDISAALLLGWANHLSDELRAARQDAREAREKADTSSKQLSDKRAENAVLKERLAAAETSRHLRNIAIVVGTVLIGAAFQLQTPENTIYSIVAGLLGGGLLVGAWFLGQSRARQNGYNSNS